ncbi:MAG: hypothetical protein M0R77_01050 [Gammaproteobacteria bacterium]|nr:hypothetical protein [Acholeplasmataceae bacterium]MCK9529143.1 hypothetical protein [Gammaproteobacteria bacterium]
MSTFAFQVGEPVESPDSLLKQTDLFEEDTLVAGEVPELNKDTTFTAILNETMESLDKAISFKKKIKETGLVSRAMAMEAVDEIEGLELLPLGYYTEKPTASLGEPTVENLTAYINVAWKRAKEFIIKAFEAIQKFIKDAVEKISIYLKHIHNNKTIKALEKVTLPNSISIAQADKVLSLLDSDPGYGNLFIDDAAGERRKGYLSTFMKDPTSVSKSLFDIFRDPRIRSIYELIQNEDTLIKSMKDGSLDITATLETLKEVNASFTPSKGGRGADAFSFSINPSSLIKELEAYRKNRLNSEKSTFNTNATLDKLSAVSKATASISRLNPTRIADKMLKDVSGDDELKAKTYHEIVEDVSALNEFFTFILTIEKKYVEYVATLQTLDVLYLKVVGVLKEGEASQESIVEDTSFDFSQLSRELSFSLEAIDTKAFDKSKAVDINLKETKVSEQLIAVFNRIKAWFEEMLSRLVEWLRKVKANLLPRINNHIQYLQTAKYEEALKDLQALRRDEKSLEDVLKTKFRYGVGSFRFEEFANIIIEDSKSGNRDFSQQLGVLSSKSSELRRFLSSVKDALKGMSVSRKAGSTDVNKALDALKGIEGAGIIKDIDFNINALYTRIRDSKDGVGENKNTAVPLDPREFLQTAGATLTHFSKNKNDLKNIQSSANAIALELERVNFGDIMVGIHRNIFLTEGSTHGPNYEVDDSVGEIAYEYVSEFKKGITLLSEFLGNLKTLLMTANYYVLYSYQLVSLYIKIISAAKNLSMRVANRSSFEALEITLEFLSDPNVLGPTEDEVKFQQLLDNESNASLENDEELSYMSNVSSSGEEDVGLDELVDAEEGVDENLSYMSNTSE